MDNPQITPSWRGTRLVPTGKLTLHKHEIKQERGMIFVRYEAIDEIGAIWDVGHSSLQEEIKCLRYPENLFGMYVLSIDSKFGTFYYRIQATSFMDAKSSLMRMQSYVREEQIKLCGVRKPDPEDNGLVKQANSWD